MTTILVASSEPRSGRSLIAAALAYRLGRAGRPVTLVRLAGDESAAADAATFASLESIVSPGAPVVAGDVASIGGDVVAEAPAGLVKDLAAELGARVVVTGRPASAIPDVTGDAALILTNVAASEVAAVAQQRGVVAVLPEDAVLAAPSVSDIAAVLNARLLTEEAVPRSIERVMIGTVASDSATPYFVNRNRICVLTRFDKTDIQLAALQTDLECLVITGGREPSPYLIDRVLGSRPEVALLLAPGSTVESMNAIEGLYGASRFEGDGKLLRAVELLDAAGAPVEF